jgi:hypothetical protein
MRFSWLDLSGELPVDWDFIEEPRSDHPGAQLLSPWLGPDDETGGRLMIAMLRHPHGSGGSIKEWFAKNVVDTGIDRKVGEQRDFAGVAGYWLVPTDGFEDLDLVIYAEFADRIYQFRIIGLDSEIRLAPSRPLTAAMRSLRFGSSDPARHSEAS